MRKQLSVAPATIRAHSWSPAELRSNPDEAFDLFDANCDGKISVAELLFTSRKTNEKVRSKGCLFEEMKLFQSLDVNHDSTITRAEFCEALQNLDEANLAELAALAEQHDSDDVPEVALKPKPAPCCTCFIT